MATSGRVEALFKGGVRPTDHRLCVRWYLRYKLSTRELVEMMAERGVILVHTTILSWVLALRAEFERRWNQYARPVAVRGAVTRHT
jgi:transposase-like protein